MNSHVTDDFTHCFNRLPKRIQRLAKRSYRIWKQNPNHPGIDFKQVSKKSPIFSVRVGIGWRALGVKKHDTMIWFWIGSHAEYQRLLKQVR